MKPLLILALLGGMAFLAIPLRAQNYDTPPFNFDRSMDRGYVDSLLRATRARLVELNRFSPSARLDTARLELLHFAASVQYNGSRRDSALRTAEQLIRLAEGKANAKYQIKGLLLAERYHRAVRSDFPQALRLNYRLLALVESAPARYERYFWRIYRNLGGISTAIGEYDEAVTYLRKSLAWFDHEDKTDVPSRADLHQHLAEAYLHLDRLDSAETHYLRAWHLLQRGPSALSNKAFLSNDIGQLYNRQHRPAQAVPYLRQSAAYWAQLNAPMPQSDALADLSESYLSLNRYPEAIETAQLALAKNQKVYATMLTAYSVLIRAYEHLGDWRNAFAYQKLYNQKKEEQQQAINQVESLRQKARFERQRLQFAHQRERLLQQQRYATLAKQAEIDRLTSAQKTAELLQKAQEIDLEHRLERQRLAAVAVQKQARQEATIKQLRIDQLRQGLSAQEKQRNLLVAGLGLISLLGLLLLYYSLRLRRTNLRLRTKNREIEMALIKGQTLERKRVAVELHDRVSSLLGATKMTFQTIDADNLPPREQKLYQSSLALLDDAVTQIHELAHNLIPDQVLQQDLATSLRQLVKKLNGVGKTEFSLDGDPAAGLLPLPHQAKFNLYVMCLELCTNILRHAQARHASLRLTQVEDSLALEVRDDGIGLAHPDEAGMGLQNIRQRAASIGARFWLDPQTPQGTIARIRLPLSSAVPG